MERSPQGFLHVFNVGKARGKSVMGFLSMPAQSGQGDCALYLKRLKEKQICQLLSHRCRRRIYSHHTWAIFKRPWLGAGDTKTALQLYFCVHWVWGRGLLLSPEQPCLMIFSACVLGRAASLKTSIHPHFGQFSPPWTQANWS